jgi:hypothetical protein
MFLIYDCKHNLFPKLIFFFNNVQVLIQHQFCSVRNNGAGKYS